MYSAEEINSNIAYGITSKNNITKEELESIQRICEENIILKKQIKELKKSLKLACKDIVSEIGSYKITVESEFKNYIKKGKR